MGVTPTAITETVYILFRANVTPTVITGTVYVTVGV